jgi:hypothetical protein
MNYFERITKYLVKQIVEVTIDHGNPILKSKLTRTGFWYDTIEKNRVMFCIAGVPFFQQKEEPHSIVLRGHPSEDFVFWNFVVQCETLEKIATLLETKSLGEITAADVMEASIK